MRQNKLIPVLVFVVGMVLSLSGLPSAKILKTNDEVSQAAALWEADVRSVYADAVKQDFADDKAAFDWLQVRMRAATVHATEGIREAESRAAADGWSLEKARRNWKKWSVND